MKISATIITLNEEANIQRALESLGWADEIIVVDSGSTDRTVEIARRFTNKVIVKDWPGYSAQKNFAAEQARNDWIFSLDADEQLSPELIAEIVSLKEDADDAGREPGQPGSVSLNDASDAGREPGQPGSVSLNDASDAGREPGQAGSLSYIAAYEMPRLCRYMGRWIKHSGWYPDYKLRLYNRNLGSWKGDFVHESVSVQGEVRRLQGDLLHYTVRSASEHHQRMDRYTTLAAEEMRQRGKRTSAGALMIAPAASFIRSYLLRFGFLDGIPGLAIAYFAAHYAFLKYAKLWERERGVMSD